MAALTAEEVYEQAVKPLPAKEQIRLVEWIAHDLGVPAKVREQQKRLWREIRGIVDYPYLMEDAQQWISRGRREADEYSEK